MTSDSRTLTDVSDSTPPLFVGLDVGGTNIEIGLVDDAGRVVAYESLATQVEKGPEDAARRMGEAILQMVSRTGVDPANVPRVGLATAGFQDVPSGMLLSPPNLPGWEDFPIRDRLHHHCGMPVTYANDGLAAAFGEYWTGSGRQFDSVVLLTLGTGIGGGIIQGDRGLEGQHSLGGECGHILIDQSDEARLCGCGQRGHLEAYASATALVKFAEEALRAGQTSSLTKRLEAGEPLSALLVGQEAAADDPLSLSLVMDVARYLAVGIVSIVHILDPDGVVLGGAMNFGGNESELGRKFLDQVRKEVYDRCIPVLIDRLLIEYAALGGDAGFIGAAAMARADDRAS